MKKIVLGAVITSLALSLIGCSGEEKKASGKCDYSWQRDSIGRLCGGRAASVRPGGK